MKHSLYFILAGTLLLSSCGVLKKYHRPDVNTEGLYRDTASVNSTLPASEETTLGQTPWREVFTDACLQQLIDSALSRNVNLQTAELSIKQAKDMLKVARLAYLPAIQFSGQGTVSSWDHNKASQIYQLPLEASWSLNIFDVINLQRSQKAAVAQTEDYTRAVRTGVIAQVANMYYTLLMLDRQLAITRNTEQLTKSTYELMMRQKALSGANESAVQSAKANYYSVRAAIPEIERQIREVENALSLILCESPHQIQRSSLAAQSLPERFSVGIPVQALANRPDVHAAEMQLAQCFYNVQRARAAFYPSIMVSGSGAWTNSGGMGIVNPGKLLATAVGRLTQPIFMRGALTAQVRVAKAQQEAAQLAWQQSVLNAGSEVSNALALYQTSNERVGLLATQVESLERNVEVAEKLFKMSSNYNYLNIISAQQSLLQAQLQLTADQFNKMQAVVNLYYALGGGQN